VLAISLNKLFWGFFICFASIDCHCRRNGCLLFLPKEIARSDHHACMIRIIITFACVCFVCRSCFTKDVSAGNSVNPYHDESSLFMELMLLSFSF
jgi:hypothetical protein